ncbi:hypothetical protein [Priestia megaterium]|uniref:hypothetical protein n=1 Tax=Priestia megaterium TaxID=1404 RepID=UPI002E1F0555|nr:hypothetical protein [Priestia megaterium]
MELTVNLEIKQGTYEYEGRTVQVLNGYFNGEQMEGLVGYLTIPLLEKSLMALTEDLFIEGIMNATIKIKTPNKLPLQVQSGLYNKFMYDEVFKDIIFLT